jgi:hypothetical protein
MPFSSGVFTLYSTGNPVVTGTTISSAWANNTLGDISSGLSTCVLKDGTQTITANIPFGGFKITGLAAGTASGDSVRYEQAILVTGANAFAANQAMGGFKFTGLGAGTANGDSVRYEQSPAGILTAKGSLISSSAANTPAEVAVGADGKTVVANSNNANGLNWDYPALRSYLSGCTLSTAGSSATMSIAAGTAVDSTNVSAMVLAAIAKTTSAWAVGTAQGGLDTGAIANATWYHFYAIKRTDTGVVDVVFSTNASLPTLPANYTLYRRIGSGLTDGSAHWVLFTQTGDDFYWSTPGALDYSAAGSATAALVTCNLPLGVKVKGYFALYVANGANGIYLSDPANADLAPSVTVTPLNSAQTSGGTINAQATCWTNTSSQIRHREINTGNVAIVTLGWKDRRGRDA